MSRQGAKDDVLILGLDGYVDAAAVRGAVAPYGVVDPVDLRTLSLGLIAEVIVEWLMVPGEVRDGEHRPWDCTKGEAVERVVLGWLHTSDRGDAPPPRALVWLANSLAGTVAAQAAARGKGDPALPVWFPAKTGTTSFTSALRDDDEPRLGWTLKEDLVVGGLDDWADASWAYQTAAQSGVRERAMCRMLAIGLIAEVIVEGLMVPGDVSGGEHEPWHCSRAQAIERIVGEWLDDWRDEVPTPAAIVWLANTPLGDALARSVLARDAGRA